MNSVDTKPVSAASAGWFLVEILALAGRRLHHLRRAPGRLLGLLLNPLVTLLALGYLFKNAIAAPAGGDYQDYLMAGIVAQAALASIGPTAIGVAMDLRVGLMDRFRSLPISRSAVLIAHSIGDFLAGLGVLVVVTGVGLLIGWRPHGSPLSIAAGFGVAVAFLMIMIWVGITLGVMVKNIESIDSIGALVVVLCTFLSSSVFPVTTLPGWLQPLIRWNPVSSVADSCRHFWGNPTLPDPGFLGQHRELVMVLWLAVLAVGTVVLSLRRFRTAAA
ncbi:ABC transporter permease [Nocardia sp. NPDC051570]|uniref:ABC transporter permease n=1 Tax=Nocardia sp. NPDC051570 TaxID=3364324 RepID=UPI0037BC3603